MVTVRFLTVPISLRMVKTSRRACVGCSPTPSPALITGRRHTAAARATSRPRPTSETRGAGDPDAEQGAIERGLDRMTDKLSKHLDSLQRDKEDDKNYGEGSMGYLKTHNKYLVYLARNCDRHKTRCALVAWVATSSMAYGESAV